jgi:hypothetical protein
MASLKHSYLSCGPVSKKKKVSVIQLISQLGFFQFPQSNINKAWYIQCFQREFSEIPLFKYTADFIWNPMYCIETKLRGAPLCMQRAGTHFQQFL